jgi:L-2-hydroxyglutarate oxidase
MPVTAQETDVLVIGGGLVGLSTAMHLQELQPDLKVTLLEKDARLAAQQSGHNSGVLHAGIYYEPGSLKAQFCVEGHSALIEFCIQHGIPVVHCGKVIVANTDEEVERLDRLHERGTSNGVPDLSIIDSQELREIEPNVRGVKALHAPHSAVVDYKKIAAAYAARIEANGGTLLLSTGFISSELTDGVSHVETTGGKMYAKLIINCAGLHADVVARATGANPGLRIIPFRGEYYELRKESRQLVNGLVYPVPNPKLPFLDVHLTPRVDGSVEAGPNAVLATKREGYRWRDFSISEFGSTLSYGGFWRLVARHWRPGISEINRSLRKSVFVKSLQQLVPKITADDLIAGGSGVRAQAVDGKGQLIDDFRVEESPGAIHVLNAPSPAATSSMMIGRYIARKADNRLSGTT